MKLSNRNSTLPGGQKTWAAVFVAVLFFLCSADQFFTTRLFGFNFRWGQILLALWAIATVLRRSQDREALQEISTSARVFISTWGPFFAAYTLAAFLSPQTAATLIKAGWGLFNIGLAFFFFSGIVPDSSLKKGMKWGIAAIAAFLWTQALAVYWGHWFQNLSYGMPSIPLIIHTGFGDLPLGFAQPDYSFLIDHMVRPNAFYYEPSYAGCALGFALPLLIFSILPAPTWQKVLLPALVWTSIILTTSRSGLLDLFLFLGMGMAVLLVHRERENLKNGARVILIGTLFLTLFLISPFADDYLGTFLGVKGPDTLAHLSQPQKSEGGRIQNIRDAVTYWKEHAILGNGAQRDPATGHIETQTMNTWLEIAVESGILGLTGLLFAVGSTVRAAWNHGKRLGNLKWVLCVAWIIHFGVNLNLTQTFPRLDYWLLFFFSISLLQNSEEGSRQKNTLFPKKT